MAQAEGIRPKEFERRKPVKGGLTIRIVGELTRDKRTRPENREETH